MAATLGIGGGASYEELKEDLETAITGVNRYNPNNIDTLEACIVLMLAENYYDKDILLTTLKLYQLNPLKYNESVVCQILLKTMTVFPRNDYALAKYLIDAQRVHTPEMRRVMAVGALLEACNFSLFWRILGAASVDDIIGEELLLHDGSSTNKSAADVGDISAEGGVEPAAAAAATTKPKSLTSAAKLRTAIGAPADVRRMLEPIVGFDTAVRAYACHVISVTFQRIDKRQLSRLLGGLDDQALASYAKAYGWTLERGDTADAASYFISNHEDTIKSRNIEERLRFEQCTGIMKFESQQHK